MLQSTFQFLKGHGPRAEETLWEAGVLTWADYRRARRTQKHLFPDLSLEQALEQSEQALARGDTDYFASRLPTRMLYRIALTFPNETMFLDIESTGLSIHYDEITLIGWQMGGRYHIWLSGDDPAPFLDALVSSRAVVTFNGTLFDLPFIRKRFPDATVRKAHVDLRYLVRHIGLKGGQKEIESKLKFDRSRFSDVAGGEFAPALWYDYLDGDVDALRRLIAYNYADVQGLRFILDRCIAELPDLQPAPKPVKARFRKFYTKPPILKFTTAKSRKADGIFVGKYRRNGTPRITLEALYSCATPPGPVIGMDLTGSEARPTGVCVLEGSHAETQMINTDADLLALVESVRPTLVSIDSPLSLPRGRTTVEDSDPGRKQFGITRECERVLKKRGINVYPCLIQSMQRLTARGIWIATELRKRGFAVIESYPGAAQDIMRIPRKRASLEKLRRGLTRFGVEGAINTDAPLKHDELDAITAAIVGVFHWSGRFEALGNENEDYLIIPDLGVDPQAWLSRKVVGFSGRIYSGKTTAARHLESRGYAYGRFSAVLAQMLAEQGLPSTREFLQKLGVKVFQTPGGQRSLGQILCRSLNVQSNAVVDGLRHPEDHALLVENFGPAYKHVHVQVDSETRRARYVAVGHTVAEFELADAHDAEGEVAKLTALAHNLVRNDGSLEEFTRSVEHTVAITQDRKEAKRTCLSPS